MEEKNGLSSQRAAELLREYGKNTLGVKKRATALKMFAGQFKDTMVMILLAATVISVVMNEVWDALTILIIVVLNAVLGFVQEYRTEKTLEAIKAIAAPTAKVRRDGRLAVIPAEDIVPGDVLELEAGDKVPADCRVLSSMALECDESVLTGESFPVSKQPASIDKSALNQTGAVYMGTIITKGHCAAEVYATGKSTQTGQISGMLGEAEEEPTPLQKRLSELGKIIGIGCIAICILVSLVGILRGYAVFDMLFTGITLAVAAIPEGLPATVTISLALAVRRIYKQKALVNKLHSVETLGCTNVICTDKTGTLTMNKMTVSDIYADGKYISEIHAESPVFKLLFGCGVLCCNASLDENGAVGDPTEIALLEAAKKANLTFGGFVRISEKPFDSATRLMEVTVRSDKGEKLSFMKGAPDAVIVKCGSVLTSGGITPLGFGEKRKISSAIDEMTKKALRSLAFAYKPAGADEYVFIGLQGMRDPLRPEIKDAVRKCRTAGIRVVMLTGDHINTAVEIARQAGIMRPGGKAFSGAELAGMSDEGLREEIKTACVFARVSPSDKLRIVRAFRLNGDIAAMTGDGVNDAAAVKEAAIGVAMGKNGTDVTREAAQLVLLDDNFATLVAAVEQGRTVYGNIRKFIRYMLACNIGEVITMLFAMLCGMPVVLVPIQLLLINLVTDGLPAIALGMEPPEEGIMLRPPRKSNESVFSGGMLGKILLRGLLIGISTLAAFSFAFGAEGIEAARTAALVTLGVSQLIFVFECKDESRTLFTARYRSNLKLIAADMISLLIIAAVIYFPSLRELFSLSLPSAKVLLTALAAAAAVPVLRGIAGLLGKGGE